MPQLEFPGFPAFLDAVAARTGYRHAAERARNTGALAALSNLCAQSLNADAAGAWAILAKASEFRDQLFVAYRAAELMLADAYTRRGWERPQSPEERSSTPARAVQPVKRTAASS